MIEVASQYERGIGDLRRTQYLEAPAGHVCA
jgi:hypothetical protein